MRLISLAALALGLTTTMVSAADVSITTAKAPPPKAVNPFYVAFSGGLAFPGTTIDDVGPPVSGRIEVVGKRGYRVGGALGFNLSQNLAVEAELAYLKADPASAKLVSGAGSPLGPFPATGSAWIATAMANILLGAPIGAWRPYIGGGVGVAYFNASNVAAAPLGPLNGSDTGLALQGLAGIDFAVSDAASIGARYRYLRVSDISIPDPVVVRNNITAPFQSVEAVVTFQFGK